MTGPGWADVSFAATLVPAQDQRPPNAPEFGGSSPIGLVVILLLFVAVFFLIRSMNTHLRKVPASFDEPDQQAPGKLDGEQPDGERLDPSGDAEGGGGPGSGERPGPG